MENIEKKIANLKQKLQEAEQKKKRIEAKRKLRERLQARKNETRKKILIGAAVLAQLAHDDNQQRYKKRLINMMDQYLTKPSDRALFNLDALADKDLNK